MKFLRYLDDPYAFAFGVVAIVFIGFGWSFVNAPAKAATMRSINVSSNSESYKTDLLEQKKMARELGVPY